MSGLFETIRTRADATENEPLRRLSRRYLSLLDVGVLLITLLVFVSFLLLLNNFVFPQGTRLGDIAARDASGQTMNRTRGDVDVMGDGLGGFGDFVAQLADVRREVKIRPADSVAWTDAQEGVAVNNRDALQTFANSRARIDFTTDNHLQIGQNSLVIFSSNTADPFLQRRDPAVVVMQGELGGAVNEGYGAFAVQLPAGVAVLSADEETGEIADFKLSVNADKSSTIALYAGKAAIDVNGRNYQLARNQALTVTEDGRTGGVRKMPGAPRVTLPGRNMVAKFRDMPPRVNFEWSPVARAQNYRLELARDANFEEIIVDEYLNETSFVHGNLAAGNYFWRVSARNGWVQGPVTQPRRLRVVQDLEAPLLELSPIQQAATGEYELRGRTSPDAKVYVRGQAVPISADGTFKFVFTAAPGAETIVVEAIDSVGNIATNSQVFYGEAILSRSD
jgi:hypothetical protein